MASTVGGLCPIPSDVQETSPKLQMQKTFAGDDRAITILATEPAPYTPATTTMPIRKPRAAARRASHGPVSPRGKSRTVAAAKSDGVPTGFYRDLVWNLRNGVLAVTREGRIADMISIAYGLLAQRTG